MYHDFWLLREEKYKYIDYDKFISRKDALVSIHDEVLRYFYDTLLWIPTLNPVNGAQGQGLNMWGPTIINQTGGELFHRIFHHWSQLLMLGPEHLKLQGLFYWQWPFDEPEHIIHENEVQKLGAYEQLEVERDSLVQQLTTLAQFGAQVATGSFFILHLGI